MLLPETREGENARSCWLFIDGWRAKKTGCVLWNRPSPKNRVDMRARKYIEAAQRDTHRQISLWWWKRRRSSARRPANIYPHFAGKINIFTLSLSHPELVLVLIFFSSLISSFASTPFSHSFAKIIHNNDSTVKRDIRVVFILFTGFFFFLRLADDDDDERRVVVCLAREREEIWKI